MPENEPIIDQTVKNPDACASGPVCVSQYAAKL